MTADQFEIAFEPPSASAKRRIDVTFERLDAELASMGGEERDRLGATRNFHLLVIASRLRTMEMSEAEAMPGRAQPMADTYDRIVQPGEHAPSAILRVFASIFPSPASGGGG